MSYLSCQMIDNLGALRVSILYPVRDSDLRQRQKIKKKPSRKLQVHDLSCRRIVWKCRNLILTFASNLSMLPAHIIIMMDNDNDPRVCAGGGLKRESFARAISSSYLSHLNNVSFYLCCIFATNVWIALLLLLIVYINMYNIIIIKGTWKPKLNTSVCSYRVSIVSFFLIHETIYGNFLNHL